MGKTRDELVHLYQQIFEHLPMGMVLVDANQEIVLWNRWMEEQTQIKQAEAIGQTLQSFYKDTFSERFQWALKQALTYAHPQVLSTTLNQYVFPIALEKGAYGNLEWMQQELEILPIRQGKQNKALIIIKDVSITVLLKNTLMAIAAKFEKNSLIDALTHCYNRRFLFKYLKQELEKAMREQYPLTCCLFDIDHFKLINDSLGHDAGDKALIIFVQQIQSVLEPDEYLFRYGGEEFICIFPHLSLQEVLEKVEKIREQVQKMPVSDAPNKYITCSVGVSHWQPNSPTVRDDELISAADKQLYKAKNAGRDRVSYEK